MNRNQDCWHTIRSIFLFASVSLFATCVAVILCVVQIGFEQASWNLSAYPYVEFLPEPEEVLMDWRPPTEIDNLATLGFEFRVTEIPEVVAVRYVVRKSEHLSVQAIEWKRNNTEFVRGFAYRFDPIWPNIWATFLVQTFLLNLVALGLAWTVRSYIRRRRR